MSTDDRIWVLVEALGTSDPKLYISRVENLTFHLSFLREKEWLPRRELFHTFYLRQIKDDTLQTAVREMLALIGCMNPLKGRGILI